MSRSPWAPRFCNFHLNSCDVPSFAQGGLQLQVWRDSTNLAVVTSSNRATMTTSNELVEWTQYMKLTGASLTFGISSASSQTWGDFSGVQVQIPGGSLLLDEYSADYSQQNSGVTFGANRVSSLVLVWSKVTYADGSYTLDSTPRVGSAAAVHPRTQLLYLSAGRGASHGPIEASTRAAARWVSGVVWDPSNTWTTYPVRCRNVTATERIGSP